MDFELIVPVIGGLVASLGALLAGSVARWISRRREESQGSLDELMAALDAAIAAHPVPSTLDNKLEQAAAASAQLTKLTAEIAQTLDEQVAETKRLRADAAEARAFMNANEEVVAAVRAMLRSELRDELKSEFESRGKSDRRFQIGLAVGGFLAGIVGTVVFQIVWTSITGN